MPIRRSIPTCATREIGDVAAVLEDLDIDVVSFEAARSTMQLVGVLQASRYRGGIGPGIYDVHSPVVPNVSELEVLIRRALDVVGPRRLWVNPDCGLKTRGYDEVSTALANMVAATGRLRAELPPESSAPGALGLPRP